MVLCVTLLAACGATPDYEFTDVESVAQRAKAEGADLAYALLSDGTATLADVNQSVLDFRECVESFGMILEEPTVNPVDGWYPLVDVNYNGVTDPEVQKEASACFDKTLGFVSIAYEISHEAEMDAALMAAVQECLVEKGIPVSGTEKNVKDLVKGNDSESARGSAVIACIDKSVPLIYPGASYSIAF